MNIFIAITLISAIVSGLIAIYATRYKNTKGALSFSALLLAGSLYAIGYTFELTGTSVADFRFGLYIEYLGIPFIPFFWILFTLQFVGKQKWINWKLITPLLFLSIVTFVLHFTNDFHHLYYKEIKIDNSGPFPISQLVKGPWYWVYIAYINIATLFGNLLLIEMFIKTSPIYRKQVLIMVLGSLCPWFGHIIYQLGAGPHGIDISPISISATGIIYAWGLFHFKMLDIFPIALENVFNSINDPVIIIDNNNRIIDLNNEAEKLTNEFQPRPVGRSLESDFGKLSTSICAIFTDVSDNNLSLEINSKYYLINKSLLKTKGKKPLGMVVILNDITEQKIIENALRESESQLTELNATKDKFFSIIAHDLKNPFNTIVGLSDYLVNHIKSKESKSYDKMIHIIHGASKNGYKLLENLLEWASSQIERVDLNPQRIKLSDLVYESTLTVENSADKKKIKIEIRVSDELFVMADIDMMKAIFRNLLSNAVKFTNKNGIINISAKTDASTIIVSVKDNGVGMSNEDLNKLFKIEHIHKTPGTDNETGTGLGLLLCKEFVEKNNGKITVKSELDKGSEFLVAFPKS
jgi:signal transduction histidine kinase